MPVRKSHTKRKKAYVIRKWDLFQILLFVGLCWYLARCGASQRYGDRQVSTSISKSSEDRKRVEIASYAKKYIGSKYRAAGRSPKGFDCSGFTYFVMKNFDIDLIPVSREQEKQGRVISVEKAQPGDLLFFRRSKKGSVYHVALVVSNDKNGPCVVHSSSNRGVVLDNIYENSYWKTKVITARDVINR